MANHQALESHSQKSDENGDVAVVMVPLQEHSHINQLLHLSRLISAYNIPVHFSGTTTRNRLAKIRVQGWDPLSITNIHFHDFDIPPVISNSNIPPSLHASTHLRQPVYSLVQTLALSTPRVVVIYDFIMSYVVQDIHSIPNISDSYCFIGVSAFSTCSTKWELGAEEEVPSFPSEISDFLYKGSTGLQYNSGDIYNTSRMIEGLYLDLIAKQRETRQWAIGPFNPTIMKTITNGRRHECLEWLDKQVTNSVILVSFGTTTSMSDEQIGELAIGLEKSEAKFIWVLRDADSKAAAGGPGDDHIEAVQLPQLGYEERLIKNNKGIIVRDWAPQLEILGHPSTGGFMSHCGWNSCIESITMGVPIATWPMHTDQPANAKLITKILKIGVELKSSANHEQVIISSTIIEKGVRKLMASAEGDEIRKRAAELGEAAKQSMMEGGVTRKEMDSFIAHITR